MPVNYILLSVLSGIIGLVISGFTAWHIHLTASGSTTIESMEKTRYLSPKANAQQLRTYLDDEHVGQPMMDMARGRSLLALSQSLTVSYHPSRLTATIITRTVLPRKEPVEYRRAPTRTRPLQ
jgi:hypothetical protein